MEKIWDKFCQENKKKNCCANRISRPINRKKLFSENKNKAGIYMFENKLNGNSYLGSSLNLGKRFRYYLNTRYIKSLVCNINRALLVWF